MEMSLTFFFIFSLSVYSPFSIAASNKNIKTPSYKILIDAQLSCSNKPLEPYRFVRRDEKEPFTEIAPKVWGVIKSYNLKELTIVPNKRFTSDYRLFELSYIRMGQLRCGEPILELSKNGSEFQTRVIVRGAFQKPGFFDTSDDDPDEVRNNETLVRYDMVRDGPNDGPAIPGQVGLPCLVQLADVLKSQNSIDLGVLCKGEKKQKIEFTKKEIARAVALWKSAK